MTASTSKKKIKNGNSQWHYRNKVFKTDMIEKCV